MKKIKYIQLEPMAVLADTDLYRIGHKAIACYFLLIMHLYNSNGKLPLDMNEMSKLCICDDEFEPVWEKIRHKFVIKDGTIKHKRVSRELRDAKRRLQAAKKNGLKGAKKRWLGYSSANGTATAKVNKGKRNESEDKENKNKINESEVKQSEGNLNKEKVSEDNERKETEVMTNEIKEQEPSEKTNNDNSGRDGSRTSLPEVEQEKTRNSPSGNIFSSCLSSLSSRISQSPSSLSKLLYFDDELKKRICPRTQSDRTAFKNIGRWLLANVSSGHFDNGIFDCVLTMADEIITDKDVRNPPAVLTDRIKRELGYNP